jgi:hypothetical protein
MKGKIALFIFALKRNKKYESKMQRKEKYGSETKRKQKYGSEKRSE